MCYDGSPRFQAIGSSLVRLGLATFAITTAVPFLFPGQIDNFYTELILESLSIQQMSHIHENTCSETECSIWPDETELSLSVVGAAFSITSAKIV
jgi:hypothetical protein